MRGMVQRGSFTSFWRAIALTKSSTDLASLSCDAACNHFFVGLLAVFLPPLLSESGMASVGLPRFHILRGCVQHLTWRHTQCRFAGPVSRSSCAASNGGPELLPQELSSHAAKEGAKAIPQSLSVSCRLPMIEVFFVETCMSVRVRLTQNGAVSPFRPRPAGLDRSRQRGPPSALERLSPCDSWAFPEKLRPRAALEKLGHQTMGLARFRTFYGGFGGKSCWRSSRFHGSLKD